PREQLQRTRWDRQYLNYLLRLWESDISFSSDCKKVLEPIDDGMRHRRHSWVPDSETHSSDVSDATDESSTNVIF
uniref:Uncharacterized protein n=1 Tax=Ciona savignyi TaxID=51511 RepID=H2Z0S5_CIOSA